MCYLLVVGFIAFTNYLLMKLMRIEDKHVDLFTLSYEIVVLMTYVTNFLHGEILILF